MFPKLNRILVVILLMGVSLMAVDSIMTKSWTSRAREVNADIKKVHIVYMTHLDVGFTDFVSQVEELYFTQVFPEAIQTAQELRENGGPQRFVYTSHPWLILEYLKRGNASQIAALEDAIAQGDITWHAKHFNELAEAMESSLYQWGLNLSVSLDIKYNKSKKIAASSKDVPGMPRAIVPLLSSAGIKAIHIGFNPMVNGPDVPNVFWWNSQNASLLTLLHFYWPLYGGQIIVPGFDEALDYEFTIDNSSPFTAEQVIEIWANLAVQFPNAELVASSLDDFVLALLSNGEVSSSLPVLTSEMGDTWNFGIAADPYKLSAFRSLSRSRAEWIANGNTEITSDPNWESFNMAMLKLPEHNWGLDFEKYTSQPHRYSNWSNVEFQAIRTSSDYLLNDAGWLEQRSFIYTDTGPEDLSPLSKAVRDVLSTLKPQIPKMATEEGRDELQKTVPVTALTVGLNFLFNTTFFTVGFNQSTGAINFVQDRRDGRLWSDSSHPLCQFSYQTFTEQQFDQFVFNYTAGCYPVCGAWQKIGMSEANPESALWFPQLENIWATNASNSLFTSFVLQLSMPTETITKYGAPVTVFLQYEFDTESPEFSVNLQWYEKTETRLAEAMWFSFVPLTNPSALEQHKSLFQEGTKDHNIEKMMKKQNSFGLDDGWWMDVMNQQLVSPLDVMVNGSRRIHAIWDGVYYVEDETLFSFESLDAALVCPGDQNHLLTFDNSLPDMSGGMHFNIYNNLWGTAFPQWYSDDAQFRFKVTLCTNNCEAP